MIQKYLWFDFPDSDNNSAIEVIFGMWENGALIRHIPGKIRFKVFDRDSSNQPMSCKRIKSGKLRDSFILKSSSSYEMIS